MTKTIVTRYYAASLVINDTYLWITGGCKLDGIFKGISCDSDHSSELIDSSLGNVHSVIFQHY